MTRSAKNNGNPQPEKNGAKDFIAVGIGASAGGIKALKEFFAAAPPDPGMAFVVILHLSPKHESSLAEILQNETTLPVTQVTETVKVEPNHVYVIPPNKNLAMVDGMIKLTEPEPTRGTRVAVDLFFRTLANAYGTNAVCIVLSGTGSDGTMGLKQVKESNGFAIVQDPKDAEYDSMPQSAIATNLADWILPVAEMPGKLITFRDSSERLNLTNGNKKAPVEISGTEDLNNVLTLIRVQTGHDFSNYKHPTLIRRIARHLQIHELEDISAYLDLLRDNPEEMQSLVKNLLINVTNFFRDKEAFAALKKNVIPKLFAGKTGKDHVRVWSVGCASGEEAYSLTMLFREYAARLPDPPKLQIFATDVDDEAIAEARDNRYPEAIEADVSPERLRRFFVKESDKYRVRKDLRELILFAPHNILRDPPFSRLDLVVCRNLLIYLNRETQDKVLQIFHFALNEGGKLFLGNSESADGELSLYAPLDKKNRIYTRRRSSAANKPSAVLPLKGDWKLRLPQAQAEGPAERMLSFGEMHYKLVEQYAPPSVLVNEDFEIVHVSESAGRYLRFAGGEPSKSVLKAVHPDLLGDLRAALFAVRQEGTPVEFRNIRTGTGNKETFTNLIVRPVDIAEAGGRFLLVILDEEKNRRGAEDNRDAVVSIVNEDAMEAIVTRLEDDLQRTKKRLRTTIEQHETSIEELKASNEELQAVNEELRSASEELETGKEELQSLNEELTTVNQELKEKVDETNRVNSDLQNLMASTDIGTIFLDRNLQLNLYTNSVEKLFNIIPGDIGRPLDHVTHKLDYQDLTADAAQVLKSLKPSEREICDDKDNCYLVRILPYRTTEDKIEGVVITFVDITKRLEAEKRLRWLATVVESSNDAIFSFAFDQKIVSWNTGAEKMFGYVAEEAIGHQLSMLTKPGGKEEQDKLLDRTWHGETVENFETVQVNKAGALVDISLTLSPLRDENQHVVGMTATVQDITKRIRSDTSLRESEERQRLLIESATDFAIFTLSPDGKVDTWNTGAEKVFGYKEAEILGKSGDILFTPEDRTNGVPQQEMRTAAEKGRAEDERYHLRKDGSRFYASGVMTSLFDVGLQGYAKIARDLTERKKIEEALKRAQEELETKVIERTAELAETNESLRREIVERKRAEEERVGLLRKIVTTQEDERSRIARDMHDTLGQRLTALRLKIASLKESCTDNEDLCARVERLGEIGAGLDAEVSFLAWELRPAVLDDLGLVVAADNYVTEWSKHFEIPAEFQSTGLKKTRLDPETETNLYRITQEALNNTYKHAKASRVSVLLEKRHKSVVLIIEDDGIGFDPNKKRRVTKSGRGLGLIGIRERAAIVSGSVEIESMPGKGTTIYVRVPFQRAAAAAGGDEW